MGTKETISAFPANSARLLLQTINFRPGLMVALAAIGSFANMVFYVWEKNLGYWEHLGLRTTASALVAGNLLVLILARSRRLQWSYYEFSLFVYFPCQYTWLMLMNDVNQLWYASYIMLMFFLGFLSTLFLLPVHFLLGAGGALLLHHRWVGRPEAIYTLAQEAGFISLVGITVGAAFRLVVEFSFRKAGEADAMRIRAEEESRHAEEIKKAYDALKQGHEILKTYTRPSLLLEIEQGRDPRRMTPAQKRLAVLFCDIRDFTSTTEKLSPSERLVFLNSYFGLMTEVIKDRQGEIDKIMGDAFMGLFPQGRAAVDGALAFQKALQELNRSLVAGNGPGPIRNGIGIAMGLVTYGNIGCSEKMDLTVVGPAANIAARLESLTKKYGVEILVSEDALEGMEGYPHRRWIDTVQVKGSSQTLRIHEVYGHQAEEVVAYKDRTRAMLEKALTIYYQKGFKDAERLFKALLKQTPPHRHQSNMPMDPLYRYYAQRCRELRADPVRLEKALLNWEGVQIFDEK